MKTCDDVCDILEKILAELQDMNTNCQEEIDISDIEKYPHAVIQKQINEKRAVIRWKK